VLSRKGSCGSRPDGRRIASAAACITSCKRLSFCCISVSWLWHRNGPGTLDFFTADLLNGTRAYVLAVIEHGNRRVRVLGATERPVQSWVVQQARNLRAPRGALLYRPRSGQGLEEVSLDLMADP
jgi:hypothetical protein